MWLDRAVLKVFNSPPVIASEWHDRSNLPAKATKQGLSLIVVDCFVAEFLPLRLRAMTRH